MSTACHFEKGDIERRDNPTSLKTMCMTFSTLSRLFWIAMSSPLKCLGVKEVPILKIRKGNLKLRFSPRAQPCRLIFPVT